MNVIIKPGILSGTVPAPSSKSDIQRIAICAMLSDNATVLYHNTSSDDVDTVFRSIGELGAEVVRENGRTVIRPGKAPEKADLFCGESGAVSRFLIPVAAAICPNIHADGMPGLRKRPFAELVSVMHLHGCSIDSDTLPMNIEGRLTPGEYRIKGSISSQYISGLLMALPLLRAPCRITVEDTLSSAGYVDMTISVMKRFGINVMKSGTVFDILPSKYISPGSIRAEGDWSGAAYILSCGRDVSVSGLNGSSLQRDSAASGLLRDIADIRGGSMEIDIDDIPDLLPALAAAASTCRGTVIFTNAGRLAVKESDRLGSTAEVLRSMGADVITGPDSMTVHGVESLHGCVVSSHGDHRIAMAAAAAAARSAENDGFEGELTITGAESVKKSYPDFFEHYRQLGGNVEYEL